ncbi:protoporphyrinogen oxidase [Kocuria tytonicola]|uniref:Coproporphyrinogen III oxidase n=1 Tax=Kocuria tytonicola TaxID=2055946 RepID=A0A3L9LBW7_9MICC|nr:protoporphyrinogen oxidase [Kocuria tytonicola]RLY94577.1 protoporphyrinogen oxidase [Kocuria tytonicola]
MTTSSGDTRGSATRRPRTALVVGGGVAGLTAARDLAAAGLRVTLVEASDHFGGAVGAHQVAGLVLDSGAESFATRSDAVPQLMAELGLSDRMVTPDPAGSWLCLPEGAVPAPRSGVLGIPADPTDPELRVPLGRAGTSRARLDRMLPARVGAGERTVGGLVRARMGQRVVDRLVSPFVSGVYSTHPDQLDVDAVAPGLRARMRELGSLGAAAGALRSASPAGANVAGIDGGMNLLSERLVRDAERLGVKLVTRYDVIALDRDPRRQGWMVIQRQPTNGDKTAVARGELLVVAADGPTSVRLMGSHMPDAQNYTPRSGPRIALATLVLDCPALDSAPRGTGVLVSDDVRDVRAKALTHSSAKWQWVAREAGAHRHVVRLSYGRATPRGSGPSPEVTLEDKHLISLALGDASTLFGVPIEPSQLVGADVVRWHAVLPRTDAGHTARATGFRRALTDIPDAVAVGAWLSGTGLAAVVTDTRQQVARLLARHGFDAGT